jgi:hypothetical protein
MAFVHYSVHNIPPHVDHILPPSLWDNIYDYVCLIQCLSNCGSRTTGGPRRFARWSAGDFERKSIAKIVLDTLRMNNTPIHVCAETAFVD